MKLPNITITLYMGIVSLILSLILGGAVYAGLSFFFAKASQRQSEDLGREIESLKFKAKEVEDAITEALTKISNMASTDEKEKALEKVDALKALVGEEKKKVSEWEKKLQNARSSVGSEENKLQELKKGKDEAAQIAETLLAAKEELDTELLKLEGELMNSKAQMEGLQTELELSSTQIDAINEITNTVNEATSKLKLLGTAYAEATERFVNLQIQYQELEKEYAKLIQKELGPS